MCWNMERIERIARALRLKSLAKEQNEELRLELLIEALSDTIELAQFFTENYDKLRTKTVTEIRRRMYEELKK